MGCLDTMEPAEKEKVVPEELVMFVRKQSETDVPRYTAQLRNYLNVHNKQRRAAVARRHYKLRHRVLKQQSDSQLKQGKSLGENTGDTAVSSKALRVRSNSGDTSMAPCDRCGRRRYRRRRSRRRRSRCRRRRRRSRCRRRRRRSRCGRRRRRRRSCSRRRRRSSCRRRRRSRRRRCRR